jgi:hypothetical protein
VPDHVLGDGCLRHLNTELQKFPMNARSSPARVREAHVPDEIANFRRYRRATFATPTLPSPIEAKSLAMPSDNRLRFHDQQGRSPAAPELREPDPQDSVRKAETEPVTTARTLQDQELMAECKNLCLQRYASLKGMPSGRKQRENDRHHVGEKLQRRLPKFNQFSQNAVFGRSRWEKRGSGGTSNEIGETI